MLGLKTVNVVRRDDVVAEVQSDRRDVVLIDGPDLAKRVAARRQGTALHCGGRVGDDIVAPHHIDGLRPSDFAIGSAPARRRNWRCSGSPRIPMAG